MRQRTLSRWMYSTLGSMVTIALMKLLPVHRQLTELEIKNIQDYFNSDFISVTRRRRISRLSAFWMTYFGAIRRITEVSKLARQDYCAIQRQGNYALSALPLFNQPAKPFSQQIPLLIIPGLNTPTVFFREMHDYFTGQGFQVFVMDLPNDGFAEIALAAETVKAEIERLKAQCQCDHINVIGHCLGGLIAQYYLENLEPNERPSSIKILVTLGTGFLGAEGVMQLKKLWIPRNMGKPIPKVFDELIEWNLNVARRSKDVVYHSFLTIWDFMVHYRKGMLQNPDSDRVTNHIFEDPAIDHLTLALNHKIFKQIQTIVQDEAVASPILST